MFFFKFLIFLYVLKFTIEDQTLLDRYNASHLHISLNFKNNLFNDLIMQDFSEFLSIRFFFMLFYYLDSIFIHDKLIFINQILFVNFLTI